MPKVLELRRGETLLGTLHLRGANMFWSTPSFEATPDFEAVRPLFDGELAIVEADDAFDVEAWWKVRGQVEDLDLRSVSVDGDEAVDEFVLHIHRDGAAHLRC